MDTTIIGHNGPGIAQPDLWDQMPGCLQGAIIIAGLLIVVTAITGIVTNAPER